MTKPNAQRGFSLVTVIFLITVLASLATVLVILSGVAQQTPALGHSSAQAYHAARSGLEWGIAGAINTDNEANCNGTFPIGSYTVVVACEPPTTHDGTNVYVITAISIRTGTSAGELAYVRRQLRAVVSPSPP